MSRGKANALVIVSQADASLSALLNACELGVTMAADVPAALARLEATFFDVALMPLSLGARGLPGIHSIHAAYPDTPIVALGADDAELADSALRAGATEYLTWPSCPQTAALAVASAMARSHATTSGLAAPPSSGLMGHSPQMAAAMQTIARVAGGTTTVLLRGETGTGKELAARAIHAQSQRCAAPFLKVHTPAVPDALLESELFGYEKGAFTGASARKPGRVELADGGTLFLDEIGDVSPIMQAKLLRLIQDREYERLGGTRTLRADIRVVAATHRDLEHLVQTGGFREDLFYRLNVVSVWLPPLRARREDIAVIAQHYLALFAKDNRKQLSLDPGALRLLQSERWPGNVRQLVNVIERLVVLTPHEHITEADVRLGLDEELDFLTQAAPAAVDPRYAPSPPEPGDAGPGPLPAPATTPVRPEVHFSSAVRPLKEDVRRTEVRAITKALHAANGNRALAARLLGVSRRTLYTKLEEHGIE